MGTMLETVCLTGRQRQVLQFIEDRQRQDGFVPTLQETAKHFGFKSANTVREHLRLIEKKGFLRRVPGCSRALVIVRPGRTAHPDSVEVPLLGRIPAGHPVLAQEEAEAILNLPAGLFRGADLFALRVRGDSMKDAGILNNDIAIMDSTVEAEDGSIAAVLIGDEATLKRIFHTRKGLLLKAENSAFSDIEVELSEAQQSRVVGVLVGVVRKI